MRDHEPDFNRMRIGIQQIEAKNKRLAVQETNNQKLSELMESVLRELRMSETTKDDLRNSVFSNNVRLKAALKAAGHLEKALSFKVGRLSELLTFVCGATLLLFTVRGNGLTDANSHCAVWAQSR